MVNNMNYIIDTPCGKIKGVKSNIKGIIAFKGIRYATAERFQLPKEVTSWEGVYDATNYGNCSFQPRAFYNEEENLKKIFYYNEFRKGENYTYSEDCLFLNIWVSEEIKKGDNLPVLIYIHGGGFTGGCGHELHFDGPIWPKKGVIGVTINYRLGPLGFTCSEELRKRDGHSGNYGLYDQVTAIKWVKNNIASFGGNPENITIMGQSAGAMSVQQLCLSPLTKGLFSKAIMSSGGGVNKLLSTPKEKKQYEFTRKMIEFSGVTTFEEFEKISVDRLFNVWNKAKSEVMGMPSTPVIDGNLITDSVSNILKRNEQHQIPYMVGSNSEDIVPIFIYKMAKTWCDNQDIPSYCYLFNHQLPGDDNGAWHSADLWYHFGTLKNVWRPFSEDDYFLSDKMTDYLTNFVKTGNPNGDSLPIWKPSNKKEKKVMHFGNNFVGMKKVNKGKLWKNLFFNKAVGE